MIDGETRILGVIGDPVSHTLSPAIQNAALEHFNLNYRYLAFEVGTRDLKKTLDAVRLFRMPGINVTLPHKERIIPLLHQVSPRARRLGAVNTVVNRDGRLTGENTDYDGFEEVLKRVGGEKIKSAILFGAGGAARAVLAVLIDRGLREIQVACRRPARGKRMIEELGAGKAARAIPWDQRERTQADLLVNATSLGIRVKDPLPASARVVRHARAVIDLVVRPKGTRWVALARSYDVPAEEGSIMLIAQGRESFFLWFGKRPSFSVMQDALRETVGERRRDRPDRREGRNRPERRPERDSAGGTERKPQGGGGRKRRPRRRPKQQKPEQQEPKPRS